MSDEPSYFLNDQLIPAARAATREIADALLVFGIAPAQFSILDLVGSQGAMRPSSIARKLDIETSTMTTNLKRTERDGFVQRSTDPHNARGVLISLTPAGREVLPNARDAVRLCEDRLLQDVSVEDRNTAQMVILTILRNID